MVKFCLIPIPFLKLRRACNAFSLIYIFAEMHDDDSINVINRDQSNRYGTGILIDIQLDIFVFATYLFTICSSSLL